MDMISAIAKKNVRRLKKYDDVVNLLWVLGDTGQRDEKIFNNIKDIIIFAAMVGKKHKMRESLDKVKADYVQGILIETFAGAGSGKDSRVDQHNILFMFAMLLHKDMNYMRDEKIDEIIAEFEEYSNGGLSIIQGWLAESAYNPLCIFDEMVNIIASNEESGITISTNPF